MKSVKKAVLICAAITMMGAGAAWAGNQHLQSQAAFCSDNGNRMLLAGKGQGGGNGSGKQHRKGGGNGPKDGSGNGGSGPKDGSGNGNKSGTCVNS